MQPNPLKIYADARRALDEDLGDGDLTAQLIPADAQAKATIISREPAVICGLAWVEAVFSILDSNITVAWQVQEGDKVQANQPLCRLQGPARPLLSGERSALNLLQTLSGTATQANTYVKAVAGTGVTLLDTRKTLPGLRYAQKYATACGGFHNHRMGLYDAILIKENHVAAAGGIEQALQQATALNPKGVKIEIEVEDLGQLNQALAGGAKFVLLDNFDLDQLRQAVAINAGRARLEASGGVNLQTIRAIAETGVDFVSVGAITKDLHAVDLSLRFD